MLRSLAFVLIVLGLAAALAEPPAQPAPLSDPAGWWSADQMLPEERFDPLGRRRPSPHEHPAPVDNGVEPSLYRLWGLQPLQAQLLRPGEAILEVWARPSGSVRQTVVRLTVRNDGKAFVQARVGIACCTPEIARRVDIDSSLASDLGDRVVALSRDPAWDSPASVSVTEEDGAVDDLCVAGVAYDLTMVTPGRARHLRRACAPEAVGQVAEALALALSAPLGRDTRYDVLFAGETSFETERRAYEQLLARGGRLKAGLAPGSGPGPSLAQPTEPSP